MLQTQSISPSKVLQIVHLNMSQFIKWYNQQYYKKTN